MSKLQIKLPNPKLIDTQKLKDIVRSNLFETHDVLTNALSKEFNISPSDVHYSFGNGGTTVEFEKDMCTYKVSINTKLEVK